MKSVWWCPPLFAFAAVGYGLSRPAFDALVLRQPVRPATGQSVVVAMALFTLGYAASGFLPVAWWVKLLLLLALFAASAWWFDRTPAALAGAATAAFTGWLAEHLLTSHGLFFHKDTQLLGVAGWIPGLYALASVALGSLGRWLVAGKG